jgi:hypothetical protein
MQDGAMTILRSIFAGAALLALPVEAQEHRFEVDPVVTGLLPKYFYGLLVGAIHS